MPHLLRHVVLLLALVGLAPNAQAAIYRCPGPGGHPLFQDHPCAGVAAPKPAPTPATGRHFLWRADTGEEHVWLLGSLHFGAPELYPLPQVIRDAFDGAAALVVEADILGEHARTALVKVALEGTYQDGSSLRDHISPELWAKVEAFARRHGLPPELLGRQQPWLVTFTIMGLTLRGAGYSEELGIDRHLLEQARGRKPILELESVEQQMQLLQSMPDAEQEELLRQTLDEGDAQNDTFREMMAAWKQGDDGALRRLVEEGFGDDAAGARLQERVFNERNRTMTERIMKLPRRDGAYFVVVGAGHLVGDGSVVDRLRRHGYRITRY